MIYLENKIGVPQDIMIVKEVATKKTNKAVTEQQAKEIAQEEAKAAVDAQQFKTINGEDIRGEGNIEIKESSGSTTDFSYFYIDAADFTLPAIDDLIEIPIEKIRYYGEAPYYYGCITIKEDLENMVTIPINFGSSGSTGAYFIYERYSYYIDISEKGGITIMTDISIDTTVPICQLIGHLGHNFLSIDDLPTTVGDSTVKFNGSVSFSGDVDHYEIAKMLFKGNGTGGGIYNFYYVDGNIYGKVTKNGTDPITVRFGCEKGYYEANYDREGKTLTFTCLQVWGGGVNSVNGQNGNIHIKSINGTKLVMDKSEFEFNLTIVQPFWKDAAVKCGVDFRFKIDESGNEVIESVEPYGYQDIHPNKHRFFQNFFSTDETEKAHIGLYAAVFTQTGGSTGLTYGTINTWGQTNIKNTEENPDAEVDYYDYYVSFTVISPYTFTKYDVTVLSYYVTAEVEDTNTWKIIWKKAN